MVEGNIEEILVKDLKIQKRIKNWHELAVKNVYKMLKHDKKLMKFFPTKTMNIGRWPDR